MGENSGVAGLAALSVCEATLLSLTDNRVIDEAEARAILTDAATAHREAALLADGRGGEHAATAALIEAIRDGGNSVRRTRPAPATDGDEAGRSRTAGRDATSRAYTGNSSSPGGGAPDGCPPPASSRQ